jgi:hypothetical protein
MAATKVKKTTQGSKAMLESTTAPAIKEARKKLGFKEVKTSTGGMLYVSEKRADYSTSKSMLEQADLELITRQEALSTLMKDKKLKESLKDKWFWLAGEGMNKERELYTIDKNGELVEVTGKASPEKTVRVWNGENPLSLGVRSDGYARQDGRRFVLAANDGPGYVAPVVVGKAKPKQAVAAAALLRKIKEGAADLQTNISRLEHLLRPTGI